jgi:hypothetical protein
MEITLNLCYCGALFIYFALVPTPTCLTHVALLLLYLFCPSWLIINIMVSPKTNVSGQIVYLLEYPSSPFVEPSSPNDSSPKQLLRHSHRLCQPPDVYTPTAFTTVVLPEPAYRDVILHPE